MNDTELLTHFVSQCCGAQFTRHVVQDNWGHPNLINTCDYCDERCCIVNSRPDTVPVPVDQFDTLIAA